MKLFSGKKTYATIQKINIDANTVKNSVQPLGESEATTQIKKVHEQIWMKCPYCEETIYIKDTKENLDICPNCHRLLKMTASERVALLIDEGTFKEFDRDLETQNPIKFPEYAEKLSISQEKTDMKDGVISGIGKLNGIPVSIAVMEFNFIGGSMGIVVGEKITRAIEVGILHKMPVIVVSASGGARMQEGILSLMQMAKTSGALERLRETKMPFISIPTNPTMGGVTASFAMLGDINITEPGTLIGFAGPRVIEQTIKQKLPIGFQTAEFLLEHGMIDVISERKELKNTVHKILSNLGF
ncbi:MAG: acetyl-CoA carboxylase, carboxyltransferase subunit beta [Fusobacteria bacterium]|nr:acetyl-CoA carboxylase, carboxyltransferase subunit beta [Fusobacteriota bacterium]